MRDAEESANWRRKSNALSWRPLGKKMLGNVRNMLGAMDSHT